jgi:hypothetical protein
MPPCYPEQKAKHRVLSVYRAVTVPQCGGIFSCLANASNLNKRVCSSNSFFKRARAGEALSIVFSFPKAAPVYMA